MTDTKLTANEQYQQKLEQDYRDIHATDGLYGRGRQRSCDPFDEIVQQMEFVDRDAPIGTLGEAMPHLSVNSVGYVYHDRDPLWQPSRQQQARIQAALDSLAGQPLTASGTHRGHPRFYELLKEMERIHDSKNSDYADSASDPLRNFRACEAAGISAFDGCLTRLSDKYMRVMNLARKEREGRKVGVLSEAVTDTLLDMANYALIAIILYTEGGDAQ